MSIVEAELEDAYEHLPALSLLTDEVRRLVVASFEPVSYGFGTVIVREGEPADAFYLVTSGIARVVKQGASGDEVPLNVLRAGDSFGEIGLLAKGARMSTVRASSCVDVLRLDGGVFSALVASHPEVRTAFEAIAKQRTLWTFLRVHSSFDKLPPKTLVALAGGLERTEVAAGTAVVREGDPPDALYVIEAGRVRAFRAGEPDLAYYRTGDFFGEQAPLLSVPRSASVETVTDCTLLRLSRERAQRLLADYPELGALFEQHRQQYEQLRRARVPLDFADEILPAEASVYAKVSPDQAEPVYVGASELETAVDSPTGRSRRTKIRRFPHLYQLDEMDCGAACLAMVCRHFGRKVSISRIRDAVHTASDGTSLAGITRGAESLGLAARSVRASKTRVNELPLPAIVHWDGNHWVVLYDVRDGHVRVADPARGLRRIPRAEFTDKWSGYASVLSATERLAEAPVANTSLQWLLPFARPHRRAILIAAFLALVAAGLQLVLPILTQIVVDRVLPAHDVGLLYLVMAAIAAATLAITGAGLLQRYLLSRVAVRFDVETLDHVSGKLLDLPMSYFNTRRTGDIERRLQGVRDVREFLVQSGVQALISVTQLLAAITLMVIYSWTLALVYLATVPLYAGLMRFSATRLRPMYDSLEEAFGKYQSAQIDAIRGIETVKATAAESSLRQLMLGQFQSLADRVFRSEFLVMTYQGGLQLVTFVSLALFLFVGALEVVHGELSLGRFVSFNALIALANAPLILLLALWDRLQLARVLLGRLDDVLDTEPEQGDDHSNLRPVTTLAGQVELRHVGFRYGGPEAPLILADISLTVSAGESIAIVGRSGSGKTTLIKLLAGLVEPTEGTIRYDGIDLRTLDYRTLRRQVGFVLQESYLFDTTILANIAFGEQEPDRDAALWAARAASAHEFVQRLPLRYETRVGETGLRLSGGQQQRIAIARALYHRPPILLFDEATSSLDSESERAVKESLDELLTDRTSFVIAHRLSTVRDADRIIVLDRGRLVEQGSHDELMQRQGLYYYLASQQLEL
ncbi:MAG: peptidase domain-containing ABC transporter [Solirubrobacteraceae bacterium]